MAEEPPKKKSKKKKSVRWEVIPPKQNETCSLECSENSKGKCNDILKIPVDNSIAEESEHDLIIDTDREDNLPSALETMGDEIEQQLQEKAKKNHLSVVNVKNILKAVITNKDVVDMVSTSLKGETFDNYRPKCTRSKTKEYLETYDLEPAESKKSHYAYILDEELLDSSDDEEYAPNEESDEENKTVDSIPESPMPESPFFSSVCGDEESGAENVENIGQRTRSKLCLSETPLEAIEQQFIPPDITTDMYDTECDNKDWLDFLKDIQNPIDRTSEVIEDDNDPEYNVMVEEAVENVDFEELRHDRAVKVTKSELHALMNEWFGCEDFSSEDEVESVLKKPSKIPSIKDNCQSAEPPPPPPPVPPSSPPKISDPQTSSEELIKSVQEYKRDNFFTPAQYILLRQQMQQHIQLLLQTFLLTHKHPYVETHVPYKSKEMLLALNCLGNNDQSTFNGLNLKSSLSLLQSWESYMSSNNNSASVTQFMEKEFTNGDTKSRKRSIIPARIPPQLMSFCADSTAFIYPLLLPDVGVMFTNSKNSRSDYTKYENHLIALGLEEFTKLLTSDRQRPTLMELCNNIRTCLMPHRRARSIMSHIKWLSKDTYLNPVKYFYSHKEAPRINHFVVNIMQCTPLKQHPHQLIPPNWRKHLFRKPNILNYQNKTK